MDLSTLKPSERTIEILHPATNDPLGIRVTVMSVNDDRLTQQRRAFRNEANRLASKGKYVKAEQEEENGRTLLHSATLGWEWYNPTGSEGDEGYDPDAMPEFDGEVPVFNQKNFMKVVKSLPWFGAQIVAEIDEERAFFTI